MKLISCHIEGFGKFTDTDFSFSKGLNCIQRENGSGKTTLTAFLRAMLYGMEGYSTRSVGFPDRLHYYPWGKGGNAAYGGNLVFEKDGSEYRIERFFGEKNAKDDRMTVYRNGFLCTDLGDCPGKTVFGLDSDSFVRTVFFMSDDTAVQSSEGINRALSGMLEGDSDRPGAEEAAGKLREKAFEIRAKSRKIGTAYDVENEIFNIRNRIFNLKSVEDTLGRRYALRAEYERTYAGLKEKKKQIEIYTDWQSKKKLYEEKLSVRNAALEKLNALNEKYPQGIPGNDCCEALSSAAALFPELRARHESSQFAPEKAERLSVLHDSFQHGFPNETETEELKNIISDLSETETKLQRAAFTGQERLSALAYYFEDEGVPETSEYEDMREEADILIAREKTISETSVRNPADTPEYKRLCERFASPVPDELPEKLKEEAQKFTETENRLQQLINRVSGEEKKKFRISWIPVVMMIVSVFLLGAGVILLLRDNSARIPVMISGAALLVSAVAVFGIDTLIQNRRKNNRDVELMSLSAEKKNIAQTIFNALTVYGYYGEDPLSLRSSFENDLHRYIYLKSETEKCSVKLADLKAEAQEIRTDIDEFLGYHGIQSGIMTIQGLRSAIDRSEQIKNEYTRLTAEKNESTAKIFVLTEHKNKLIQRRRTLLSRYSLPEDSADTYEALSRIAAAHGECTSLEEEQKQLFAKRRELEAQIDETVSVVKGLLSSFGFSYSDDASLAGMIHVFVSDRENLASLTAERDRLEQEAETYRLANIPAEDPPVPDITSEQADEKIDAVLRDISTLEREIEGCENEAALISGYEEKLSEAEEKLRSLDAKRSILMKAADAIESAERSIKERYIAPVRGKFSAYAEKLGAVPGTAFSMDENFNVSFEAAGAYRPDRSLSAGQQICCSLALRMALIESIYGEEKPFLIFDDPFSGLDGRRLEYASQVIKKMSEEYQILYFCCHGSRTI